MSQWIVICRADDTWEGYKGQYFLATRTAWVKKEDAQHYADACSSSREAMVIECPRGVDFVVRHSR